MQATPDDLREFKRILAQGSTPYVENYIRAEIERLEPILAQKPAPEETPAPAPKPAAPVKTFTPIDGYSFADSKEKAEIIIHNIQELQSATINFLPEKSQFSIEIIREASGLPNLKLTVSPLYKSIVPGSSRYRVRNSRLTITLSKKKQQTWPKLKKSALDAKKTKEEKAEEKADPSKSITQMMQKLYEEGDDEMKRTINKAMWEAKHKQDTGKKDSDSD